MDPAENKKESSESTLNRSPEASQEPSPVVVRREPERDLVVWTSPARPFKRRGRQFYVSVFAMAGIVSLILFLAEGIMPVILIVSLVFLYYVLSTVQPEDIEYKITTKGIKIAGKLTEWQKTNRYWFVDRFGSELMIVDTFLIPGRLELVINPEIKEKLKKEISAYLPFEEAPASAFDKATDWFAKKLPENK
ncbi:MAG: hypothetical protein ABSC49_00595 [Candidatus Microgenomates bacterium]|jgi:hypothetical protein